MIERPLALWPVTMRRVLPRPEACPSDGQVAGEPLLDESVEYRLGFGKWEVIALQDRELWDALRPTEDLQCLGGGRDAVVGAVVDEQRPWRDSTDDVVGLEVVDALRRVDWEVHDPVCRQQRAEVFRHGDDVPTLDHQCFTCLLAESSTALEDLEEPLPFPLAWVLALQLAGAVAPSADGDDRGNALVDAAGVQRDGPAEALTTDRDRVRIDVRLHREPRERRLRVDNLVMAQDVPANAAALAAAAHVESQCHVPERLVEPCLADVGRAVLAAAEAVQNHDRRPALAAAQPVGDVDDTGECQRVRCKGDLLLHQNGPARKAWVSLMSFDISARS